MNSVLQALDIQIVVADQMNIVNRVKLYSYTTVQN